MSQATLYDFRSWIKLVVRDAAFQIHENIVRRTPIDTGRAKSSWNLSEGRPNLDVTPPLRTERNPISGEVLFEAAAGAAELTAGQALAAALTQRQNISEQAALIFISNNLDYIEQLENGSSRQAPAGMVAVSITDLEIQAIFDRAMARNKL